MVKVSDNFLTFTLNLNFAHNFYSDTKHRNSTGSAMKSGSNTLTKRREQQEQLRIESITLCFFVNSPLFQPLYFVLSVAFLDP